MSKVYFYLFLFILFLNGEGFWTQKKDFNLSKDEWKYLTIEHGDIFKNLQFRWVLYKNYGLVMQVNYDGFNSHFILYKEYGLNAYRLQLLNNESKDEFSTYMIIHFEDFNYKYETANLKVFVKDIKNREFVKDIDVR